MLDKSLPYKSVYMLRPAALPLPSAPTLPKGFCFRTYRDGDEVQWAHIETSVGEFPDEDVARLYFSQNYLPNPDLLRTRCGFLIAPDGLPIATASAWEQSGLNVLHWVACTPAFQGQGLGRAIVVYALHLFPAQRLEQPIYLRTQTWSHKAILLYSFLGFRLLRSGAFPGREDNQYREAMEVLAAVYSPDVLSHLAAQTLDA